MKKFWTLVLMAACIGVQAQSVNFNIDMPGMNQNNQPAAEEPQNNAPAKTMQVARVSGDKILAPDGRTFVMSYNREQMAMSYKLDMQDPLGADVKFFVDG
jgi:hypothetical protein